MRAPSLRAPLLAALAITALSAPAAVAATAQLTVDAGTTLTTLSPNPFGLNTAVWDDHLTDAGNAALLSAAGISLMRFPGGTTGDQYHWQTNTREGSATYTSPKNDFADFLAFCTSAGGKPLITVNYGTGTPAEAAAWVTAAKAANAGIVYWEIGNEQYGNGYYPVANVWEPDNHSDHSPSAYATNCKAFVSAMKAADPSIKVGVVGTIPTIWPDQAGTGTGAGGNGLENWNDAVLGTIGTQIDFVSIHRYVFEPGTESDAGLLVTELGKVPSYTSQLQAKIAQWCGSHAVEIMVTESNSVWGACSKQTIGPQSAVYYACSGLEWLQHGASGVCWWVARQSQDTTSTMNNAAGIYGSAAYGTLSMFSDGGSLEPAVNTPYPVYDGALMLSHFARAGDRLVQCSSSDANIGVYAARQANGDLAVLIANKTPGTAYTAALALSGYVPAASATVYSYAGESAAGVTQASQGGISTAFSVTAPPFSLTTVVMTAQGGAGATAPTITSALTASATAGTPFTYAISATGSAPVAFAASGLPGGWTLTGATISGTPAAAGQVSLALSASNGAGSDHRTLVITVAGASGGSGPPTITSALAMGAVIGTPFSYTITATGSAPMTFSASGLGDGLTLQGAVISGVVGGSPGTLAIAITASNAQGHDSRTLDLAVATPTGGTASASAAGGGGGGGGSHCGLGGGLAVLVLALVALLLQTLSPHPAQRRR